MRNPGALIVGGGPAGAAAAWGLAVVEAPHLLIERAREPQDALCGGFLSWSALAQLRIIGIAAEDLNPMAVTRTRLFAGRYSAEASLPAPARAVSRRKLDAMLLDHAIAYGARVERGVTAREIAGRSVRLDGETIEPDALFLANGKHEVRGAARSVSVDGDPALGLRLRLPASAMLARLVGDAVELHLVDRGYAGLVLQEDGGANLCLAIRRSRLTEAGDVARLIRALGDEVPALGERLAGAELPSADAVANVPYGWRTGDTVPGVFRLGDQAAVIPSLAGEGMSIALTSGLAAAESYICYGASGARPFQRRFHGQTRRPVGLASVIRAAVERGWSAHALVAAIRIAPGLAGFVARLTRINT